MQLIKKLLIIFFIILVVFITGLFLMVPTVFLISGRSMEPTFHDGDKVFTNIFSAPKIGDVLIFDCKTDFCRRADKNNPYLAKRLISINEQGCYWVEGDNKEHSWDSRKYGWICSSDINSLRTVIFKF